MSRLGRILAVSALALSILPAFVQSAGAAKAHYPPRPPGIIVHCDGTQPGSHCRVSGSGWCPGSTVEIFVNGKLIGRAVVDASGHFTFNFTIPPGTSAPIVVRCVGLDGGCEDIVTETRTVFGGVLVAPGGNLPFTGSNISAGMLILFALVVVGAVSLVAGRKRDSHARE